MFLNLDLRPDKPELSTLSQPVPARLSQALQNGLQASPAPLLAQLSCPTACSLQTSQAACNCLSTLHSRPSWVSTSLRVTAKASHCLPGPHTPCPRTARQHLPDPPLVPPALLPQGQQAPQASALTTFTRKFFPLESLLASAPS